MLPTQTNRQQDSKECTLLISMASPPVRVVVKENGKTYTLKTTKKGGAMLVADK